MVIINLIMLKFYWFSLFSFIEMFALSLFCVVIIVELVYLFN
jgi:hypothetical protein